MRKSTILFVFFTLIVSAFGGGNSMAFGQESSSKDAVSFKTAMPKGEEMILYFASDESGYEEIQKENLEVVGLVDLERIVVSGGFKGKVADENISVTVKNDARLRHVETNYGRITSLDLSKCPELVSLDCQVNQLEVLDLSKTPKLKTLNCNRNKLTSLDLSGLSSLEVLDCGTNQLASLEVPEESVLKSLYCMENKLTSLDLTKCKNLSKLSCLRNQLEKISICKDTSFKSISFYSNAMSAQSTHELLESLGKAKSTDPNNPSTLVVINTLDQNEKNVCSAEDVKVAIGKGYKVYDNYGETNGLGIEYSGTSSNSIEDVIAPSIALYPNPATDYVIVETLSGSRVMLLDIQGALLAESVANDSGVVRFDVSHMARGNYIVKTNEGSAQIIVK